MRPSAVVTKRVTKWLAVMLFLCATLSVPSFSRAQYSGPAFQPKHLYNANANPTVDIAAALKQARAQHKRVILDFGGDWCGDCQVLDIYMHQSPNAELLDKHFIVVHVYVADTMDSNLMTAKSYGVPLKKGVPALAVLSSTGQLLYSQKGGEFESMRTMNAQSVTAFLNRWKA
jgi:thiol:disulfide interchange protein